MCNAWNHAADCTCGWGGEGHLGRRNGGNPFPLSMYPKFKTYGEYLVSCTVPNAKCPVCGSPVFFYRSPSNGRVFFDDLGPPWPKHPCTSNGYQPTYWRNYSDQDKTAVAEKYYESKEWKPFLLEGLKIDTKNNVTEIIGRLFDRRRTFFTKINGLTDHFPFFIKESVSEIRLLTFRDDPSSQTFEFIVKNFVSDLTAPILDISKSNNDGVLNATKRRFKSAKKMLSTIIWVTE